LPRLPNIRRENSAATKERCIVEQITTAAFGAYRVADWIVLAGSHNTPFSEDDIRTLDARESRLHGDYRWLPSSNVNPRTPSRSDDDKPRAIGRNVAALGAELGLSAKFPLIEFTRQFRLCRRFRHLPDPEMPYMPMKSLSEARCCQSIPWVECGGAKSRAREPTRKHSTLRRSIVPS
jgi:hypothetical protein